MAAFALDVNRSGHKWVLLTDEQDQPLLMLDADGFIRSTITEDANKDPYFYCHRPLIIENPQCSLGEAMKNLKLAHDLEPHSDEVLHTDVILVWSDTEKRVITGADILGRLLKGIGSNEVNKLTERN